MSKTQMLKMVIPRQGIFRVHYDSTEKYNPWIITKEADRHKNIVCKYGDYHSCMCELKRIVWMYNIERMEER